MIIYHKCILGEEITIFDTDEYIKITWGSLRKPILTKIIKIGEYNLVDKALKEIIAFIEHYLNEEK